MFIEFFINIFDIHFVLNVSINKLYSQSFFFLTVYVNTFIIKLNCDVIVTLAKGNLGGVMFYSISLFTIWEHIISYIQL